MPTLLLHRTTVAIIALFGGTMRRQTFAATALAAVMGTILLGAAAPARADWLRAESERFIVYSDGSDRSLREYVQKLETFDRVMRYRSGLPISDVPPRKLPIYLVGSRRGLLQVNPDSGANVAGTYFPADEDIFAVAMRGENDEVLLHEYAHHFMWGSMPGAYPGWFVEGFAEYYMTADIDGDRILLGDFSENRAYWLYNGTWIDLEDLLRLRPGEITRADYRETYYPVAWLLTHWFFSDPERAEQLKAYLADVGSGGDSVDAMQRATGLTLRELRSALMRYRGQRLKGRTISGQFPPLDITVTRLPESADDLLLLNQRLKVGVQAEDREALGREVMELAARHGDDPLALLAAGHAGLHFGDPTAGERALKRLLEIQPGHIEALQLMAGERMRQARDSDDPEETVALRREARDMLARAYAAGQNDYRTLTLIAELRSTEPDYPNDNDMLTLGLAFDRAPQLADIRISYAAGLARLDRTDEAIATLKPLANSPHGGGAAEYAERTIQALEGGETPVSLTLEETETATASSGQDESAPTSSEP